MTARIRILASVAALALLAAGCSAPHASIEVGSKDIPVDIILGRQQQSVPPPPPGASPVAGFPGFISPPVPRPEPGAPPPPPPPPQKCPAANPFDASKLPAHQTAPKPPVFPATYVYRNAGTLQIGPGAATAYPLEETRSVTNVKPSGGNYDFDIVALLTGVQTTTTFRVLNEGQTPDRGIYIVQTVTLYPGGRTEAFTPDQPLLLMPFPSPQYGTNLEDELDRQRGSDYRSSGTDPLSQTTMVLQAKIGDKERVNACGKWIDSYDIDIVSGKIVGPTKNIDFSGHYLIAPQYGALVVQDHLTFSGTDGGVQIQSTNVSTINRLPGEPV